MKFIYSYGGYAREFYPSVKRQYPDEKIYFVDDSPGENSIDYKQACELSPDRSAQFVIGFAQAELRRSKTEIVQNDGFGLFSVVSQTAILGPNTKLSEGAIVSDFATLTADLKVGKAFQCNIYSYVAHDCEVGDYVTLAPRVSVNGRVHIEDNVYIGTGATILPGRDGQPVKIGKGAVVGAHALVTKDVAPNSTVVGMPARELKRKV